MNAPELQGKEVDIHMFVNCDYAGTKCLPDHGVVS